MDVSIGKSLKKQSIFSDYKKYWDLMLIMLPGLSLLILFNYVPMYGIVIAFKDYIMLDGIMGSKWIGLENFRRLFAGQDFAVAFKNTVWISLLKLICGLPAPIILALLLNEVKSLQYKKVVQTLSYIPHFFSWIVLAGIVTMIFALKGPVNMVYTLITGKEPLVFFADGNLFVGMLVGSDVWKGTGWGSIVYLSTLSSIDASLYEAAEIDGANRWQQMKKITLPSLIPTIATVFILNLSGVLNAGFDQIYNLYNPMVYDVSDILDTYVLRRMQSMDYSLSTAAGLFKSAICFILVILSNYVIKKMSDDEVGIF